MYENLKEISGRKYISYAILLIAILLKTALFFHYFQFEGDKLFQAIAAKNLVNGKGLTFQYVAVNDLSHEIFEPLNRWPPGYSLLISFFYIFTHSLITSCLIIDVLSIIFFFAILFKLLNLLGFPGYLTNLIIIFNGATIAIYLSKPTDLPGLEICLYIIYMSLLFFSDPSKKARYGIFIGFINSIAPLLRYMYLPTAFVVPCILIWTGIAKKDKRLRKGGTFSFCVTAVVIISLLIFQKTYAGSAVYITLAKTGFYPENLLQLYPVFFGSFFNLNFLILQIAAITHITYTRILQGIIYINIFFAIAFIIKFLKYSIHKKVAASTPWEYFIIAGSLINLTIFLLLALLSLTINLYSYVYFDAPWTYISDGRYFVLLMVLIPVIAGHYLFMQRVRLQFAMHKIMQWLFILILTFDITHGVYFIAKHFDPLGSKSGNVSLLPPVLDYMTRQISLCKSKNIDVAFTGVDNTIPNWAVLHGAKGILNSRDINIIEKIKAKKDTKVLLFVKKTGLIFYQPFINSKDVHQETGVENFQVFSYLVKGSDK